MHKEKVENAKGEIIEVEVVTEEEARLLLDSAPKAKVTLKEALAQGHIPLEDFVRDLRKEFGQK